MTDAEANGTPPAPTPSGGALMRGAGLTGFIEATRRYNEHKQSPSPAEKNLFVPLVEALWWARALDEQLERERGRLYITARETDSAGQVLHGLRVPLSVTNFAWRPIAELPPPAQGKDERGRSIYHSPLAGRPVHHALADAEDWFARQV